MDTPLNLRILANRMAPRFNGTCSCSVPLYALHRRIVVVLDEGVLFYVGDAHGCMYVCMYGHHI